VRTCLAVAWTLLFLVACSEKAGSSDEQPILAFDAADIRIVSDSDTVSIRAELALTNDQKMVGLMDRSRLAENAGMVFVYDSTQPPAAGFWMYRTRIPLDIAFADSAGVIRAILKMEPCETTIPQGCPSYPPNVPYQYALEVNAGFFAARGITAGWRLMLEDLPPRSGS